MRCSVILLIILLSLSFISCQKSISYDDAFNIVQNKYLIKPDTLCIDNINNNVYIAAMLCSYEPYYLDIVILKEFADTWQEIKKVGAVNCTKDFCFSVIDSIEYLYFSEESYGSYSGSVSFKLVGLYSNDEYDISFSGVLGRIDKLDPLSRKLKTKKNILTFLESKSAASSLVYKPERDDLDLNNPKNYHQNWKVNNPGIYSRLETLKKDEQIELVLPEYKTNPLNEFAEVGDLDTMENNSYRIIQGYNSIITYDKNSKNYFVAWVQESRYDPITEIEIVDNHNLKITRDFTYNYLIDLENLTLTKL